MLSPDSYPPIRFPAVCYLATLAMMLMVSAASFGQDAHPSSIKPQELNPWRVRSQELEKLISTPGSLRRPMVQNNVLALLHKLSGEADQGLIDGEDLDYQTYSDSLTHAAMQIARMHNLTAFKAMAEAPYNGDSELGLWMSSHKEALPVFLDVAAHSSFTARASAMTVLSEMVIRADGRQPRHRFPEEVFPLLSLSPEERSSAKKAIVGGLSDKSDDVRCWAISGISNIDDKQDIKVLEAARANDPQKDLLPIYNRALATMGSKPH